MKLKSLLFIAMLLIFGACKNEPRPPYAYEQNPEYTYMGLGFFAQYYPNIPYYVFSFTFLSDGMLNEDSTTIVAPGQYLYIEDFFVPMERLDFLQNVPADFVLTERDLLTMLQGEYQASGKVGAENFGDSLTFAPGELFTVDKTTYILGARIEFHEENPFFSTRKLITEGAFTISPNDIVFNFKTEDGLQLGGRYQSPQAPFERKISVKYSSEREQSLFFQSNF
jgi:hypothetical protein